MILKDFNEKTSKRTCTTGAKKVLATIVLTALLIPPTTQVAHAAVSVDRIIGEEQYIEDRTKIKIKESHEIVKHFYGYDKYGNPTITTDEIKKAIELSDELNSYYFDLIEYTNTRLTEVKELDINRIYNDYQFAISSNKTSKITQFYKNNLNNKPAIDAFITFSCGTVSQSIKTNIAKRVCEVLKNELGAITSTPKVIIHENHLLVVVEIDGQTQIIELKGEEITNIISTCNTLDKSYNTAIDNISGKSSDYENTFTYNGVDYVTEESAWLSLPDESKKDFLLEAISLEESISTSDNYEILSNIENCSSVNREYRKILKEYGLSKDELKDAKIREAFLIKVEQKTLIK